VNDPYQYADMAQQMLPSQGMPGGQPMPFQMASTDMCKQVCDALGALADQYRRENNTAAEGQVLGMKAKLLKLCGKQQEKQNNASDVVMAAQLQGQG
jgi:hypothetical protein